MSEREALVGGAGDLGYNVFNLAGDESLEREACDEAGGETRPEETRLKRGGDFLHGGRFERNP